MRARVLYVAAAFCLLPIASRAQDRRHSASPPERPGISRPLPAAGDPFRAGPETYAPRHHSRPLTSRPSGARGSLLRAGPETYALRHHSRPLTSRPSGARGSVLRVGPETYALRRHRPNIYAPPVVVFPGYVSLGHMYDISPLPYGNVPCAGGVRGCPVASPYYNGDPGDRYDANRDGYAGQVPRNGPAAPPPPAAAPPVVPLPPAVPGPAKTFYVIAGCYAGDKPPRPEWLRPDCDLSRVRVIPP